MTNDRGVTLTVTIPWVPPSAMLPNAVTSTRTGSRHRRQLRRDAATMLRSAMIPTGVYHFSDPEAERSLFMGPTHCRITVAWGKERTKGATGMVRWRQTCDGDNLLAAMKGLIDAIQDVGLIGNDRDLIHAPVEQVRDPEGRGSTTVDLWQEEVAGR